MSKVSEQINKIKSYQMDVEGKNGKFHQTLNLLLAIILGIIIPELAILVALAWLFGWVKVRFEKTGNSVNASA